MVKLVLLRHGQSVWNRENRFTGWTDVDLTEHGLREAHRAGRLLREAGFSFDVAHTSVLKRAIRTLWAVLDELDLMWIPVHRSWRLNERHYGALQGLDKGETAAKYGMERVHAWRRSFDIPPPALDEADERYPGRDPRYAGLEAGEVPGSESLAATLSRVLPYWRQRIVPDLAAGRRVLIVAHGNSLRALVKHLDRIPAELIPEVNIPTGAPLVYELDDKLGAANHYYLGEEREAAAGARALIPKGST